MDASFRDEQIDLLLASLFDSAILELYSSISGRLEE